jgi:hypothetical protein
VVGDQMDPKVYYKARAESLSLVSLAGLQVQ